MMHRSQVMLEEEHYRFLVDEAKRTGKSISSLLRGWIDQRMHGREQRSIDQDPLWDMVGIARGGKAKVSEAHDDYLIIPRMKRMADRKRKKV